MSYQLFYGNPFASGGGAATAEHAREKTEFARAVENAKLRLESRRVSVQEAQQELAKEREDRIKEQQKRQLDQQREKIERKAEEFEREQGIKKRKVMNQLRERGFRRAEEGENPGEGEVGFVGPDGGHYIGPPQHQQELEQMKEEIKAKEEAKEPFREKERERQREQEARQQKNKLRDKGFRRADEGEEPGDDEVRVQTPDGEMWIGPSSQALAEKETEAELDEYRRKQEIKEKVDQAYNSDEFTNREKQTMHNIEGRLDRIDKRRKQLLEDREELREKLGTLEGDIAGLESKKNLPDTRKDELKRKKKKRKRLREQMEKNDYDAYDAQATAYESVLNAITATPGQEPPVSLDWLERVDWRKVQNDGAMPVFSSVIRLRDQQDRRKALQGFRKIVGFEDSRRRREAWNGLVEAINKTAGESP